MDERDAGQTQTTATDILKKNIIEYIFSLAVKATHKEDETSDLTHETGFVRGVRLAIPMIWKYTPVEVRQQIDKLYDAYDYKKTEIDKTTMTEQNKLVNKQMVADEVSMQVLMLLIVALQYSPISTDFKSMEVFGDSEDLIKAIRSETPIKLFAGGDGE